MNEHEISRIADAIVERTKAAHICVFNEPEVKTLRRFTDALSPEGGWNNFQAVLDFGSSIRLWRKTASALIVTLLVTAMGSLLVFGVRYWILTLQGAMK